MSSSRRSFQQMEEQPESARRIDDRGNGASWRRLRRCHVARHYSSKVRGTTLARSAPRSLVSSSRRDLFGPPEMQCPQQSSLEELQQAQNSRGTGEKVSAEVLRWPKDRPGPVPVPILICVDRAIPIGEAIQMPSNAGAWLTRSTTRQGEGLDWSTPQDDTPVLQYLREVLVLQ